MKSIMRKKRKMRLMNLLLIFNRHKMILRETFKLMTMMMKNQIERKHRQRTLKIKIRTNKYQIPKKLDPLKVQILG